MFSSMKGRNPQQDEARQAPAGTDRQAGFTLVEVLIVVAIIGILSSVAIPKIRQAERRAEFAALMTEATQFSKALVLHNLDNGQYPASKELDKKTLEPLVSQQHLASNSFVRLLRDGEIHKYKFNPKQDTDVTWHCHPKMAPYDNGPQKIEIKGVGPSVTVKYMGKTYDTSSILAAIQ